MSTKLSKKAPAWHAQVAAELTREFAEVNELSETARRRRLRLGFMFLFVKETGKADGSIPHGHFGDWLENNVPAIPRRTVGDYITEAGSVCELLGWQKGEIRHFEPHKLLISNGGDFSKADESRRKKLLEIADQEGHFRAVTQYKQVELKDDATVAKVGRRKGEGGNSKEALEKHRLLTEKEKINARRAKCEEFAAWLKAESDDAHLGDPEVEGSEEFSAMVDSIKYFNAWQKNKAAGWQGGEA